MRYAVLALAMLATPAAAADRFDLVCTADKATVRYRVDIAKGEACSGSCDRIWKMGPSTSGQLRIIDRAPAFRGDLEERAVVNRVTGQWTTLVVASGKRYDGVGRCEVAFFSGFPAAQF